MRILSSANKKLCFKSLTLCLFILALCFFNIKLTSALSYESEQGLSFTLNPTISVNLSSNAMSINDLAPGSTSDSNIIKVTAESNAIAGYTLSSTVGNSTTYNTTNMVHTNGTNTFTNLSSNKASLAAFDPSTWGYSYAPCTTTECTNTPSWISGDITGTTNSGYNGLPLYTTENPIKLINATTPGSSAVQFKFGAKADTAQLAGTYNNVINFIGVGKIITTSYTINYNANGGSGAPAQETGSSTTGAVQISSTQPTRTDYLFKGWCTEQTSDDTCSGETVQPGGMLGLHPGTGNLTPTVTRTLYAMWGSSIPAPGLCTDATTCMQTMTSCPTTPTTVTDSRDGKTYRVQQLADNRCWMLESLRLDLMDPTVQSNLDSNTTDAEDSSLAYLKGTATYRNPSTDPNGKYPTAALGYGDSNNYYSIPKISLSGTCYDAYCVNSPASGQWDSETITPQTINGVTSIAQGKVGIFYNYCAASAGTYCYGNGTSDTGSPSSDPDPSTKRDVKEDICPKGWHIPTAYGNGEEEYDILYAAYNNNVTDFQTALVTPLSGIFYLGKARYQGRFGRFWSSTWGGSKAWIAILETESDKVYTGYPIPSANDGESIRCVLNS